MVFRVRAYRLRTETNITDGLMWQPGWQVNVRGRAAAPARRSAGPGWRSGTKKGSRRSPFSFDQKNRCLDARGLGSSYVLDRQLDTAAVVHVQYQHLHFLAFLQYIGDLLNALIAQHGDVHQTVLARQDVDEGAEVDDTLDLADVDLADLGFSSDGQHALLGSLGRFL